MPEMGEYAVGAWLRLKGNCQIVTYDQELNPTGREMNEVDVIGLDLERRKAYFCEVATHLKGVNYGEGNKDSAERFEKKFDAALKYSLQCFQEWSVHLMLWAPYVPEGILTNLLQAMKQRFQDKGVTVELVINDIYTMRINELREWAKDDIRDRGEPFYRVLQILSHLR
jgi:hypothetical protein